MINYTKEICLGIKRLQTLLLENSGISLVLLIILLLAMSEGSSLLGILAVIIGGVVLMGSLNITQPRDLK